MKFNYQIKMFMNIIITKHLANDETHVNTKISSYKRSIQFKTQNYYFYNNFNVRSDMRRHKLKKKCFYSVWCCVLQQPILH